MPLVVQELPTLPEHLSSPPVFSGVHVTRYLALCVCFVVRCLSFRPFSFGHCFVCPSSIYGFWLPPFGIFKLFFLTYILNFQMQQRSYKILKITQDVRLPSLVSVHWFVRKKSNVKSVLIWWMKRECKTKNTVAFLFCNFTV